jgi:hypothetical protein
MTRQTKIIENNIFPEKYGYVKTYRRDELIARRKGEVDG